MKTLERRQIGSLAVSVVGLGCNNFGMKLDERTTERVVQAALDAGINFFDTADMYGETRSEEYLGRALGHRRDDVVVATKFGYAMGDGKQGAHPDYVVRAVEDSLRRLGTDRIDLYQLHLPDPSVPIADTLGALDGLVRAGKVREIGCSNFSAAQIVEAEAAAAAKGSARFVSVQNEYSLLEREPERAVLAECARARLAFLPYFPLASGLLTGKYRRGAPAPAGSRFTDDRWQGSVTEEKLERVEGLRQLAEAKGRQLLELAFSWLLARPVVASVIAGATTPEQVASNVAAAGWRLSESELAAVDAIVPRPS